MLGSGQLPLNCCVLLENMHCIVKHEKLYGRITQLKSYYTTADFNMLFS